MLLDKIVIVLLVVIIDFILFKKYVKNNAKINLVAVLVSVIGISIYLYMSLKNVDIKWYFQLFIFVFMLFIPLAINFFFKNNEESPNQNIISKINRYIEEKKTFDARKLISKYLEQNEEDAEIYIMLGKCDKVDKDYEAAINNFMKAVEMDKRSYIAYYELGTIMELQGKIDTAIIMLTNANKIKPDFYDAAELLGICYTSLKKYEDALRVYLSALKYHRDSYELNYNIAVIYLERGDIDEAEEYLVSAARLSNEPYGACYSLGNIYFQRGKYQNALENYKISRASQDLSAMSLYKMAIVYSKINQIDNAEICLKYSVALDAKCLSMAKTELAFDKIISSVLSFEDSINDLKIRKSEEEIKETALNVVKEKEFMSLEKIDVIFR